MKQQIEKITVYLDGEMLKLSLGQILDMNLNTVIVRSNGYSHDWSESVKFDKSHIKNIGGNKTVWCTKKGIGIMRGSSSVSFS